MKRYLLGLFAVAIAVGFSAFKPTATREFTISSSVNFSDQSAVQNIANWSASTSCTTNADEKACTITVDETAYHNNGVTDVLNDAAYASTHPGEVEAVLDGQPFQSGGSTTYYIEPDGSIVTAKFNKVR
jgi:hypothetical protein